MFNLANFTFPLNWEASSSTAGAIARHGAHQVAQKSTRTGCCESMTSVLNSLSPMLKTSPAMISPLQVRSACGRGHLVRCSALRKAVPALYRLGCAIARSVAAEIELPFAHVGPLVNAMTGSDTV